MRTITRALHRWTSADRESEKHLLELIYSDLQKIASNQLRSERKSHTLEPAALVNEAYIRLRQQAQSRWINRDHFFAIASRVMRRVLIDHARKRSRSKRDGNKIRVTLRDDHRKTSAIDISVLWIHQALERLARGNARRARIVELRFMAGMTIDEVARLLHCSPGTVSREWKLARQWLAREAAKGGDGGPTNGDG